MSVAGNSASYRIGLLDSNGQPTGVTWDFPRVTSILDAVIAKPKLLGWYYSVTVDGVEELFKRYGPMGVPQTATEIKKVLRSNRLTPWHSRDSAGSAGTDLHKKFEGLVT